MISPLGIVYRQAVYRQASNLQAVKQQCINQYGIEYTAGSAGHG